MHTVISLHLGGFCVSHGVHEGYFFAFSFFLQPITFVDLVEVSPCSYVDHYLTIVIMTL